MPSNDVVIADILISLFQRLEQEGVEYCVLRDYEGLPHTFRSDVDFLVRPEDRQRFHDIVVEVAAAHGWQLVKHIRKFALWFHYFYPAEHDDGDRFILHIDVFSTLSWWGMTYLSADDLLRERIRYNGFFISRPGDEATMLLLKDFLHVSSFRQRYRGRIQSLIEQDVDMLRTRLRKALGRRLSDFIVENAMLGQWDEIKARRRDVQWALARRSFRQAPLTQTADFLLFLWKRQRQYVIPTGLFIVVLGSDGSGKTTVIGEVMPLVEKLFTRSRRLAFSFKTLPHISDLRNWIRSRQRKGHSVDKESVSDGPLLEPYPPLRALASLAYHTVGYLLGYLYLFVTRRLGHLIVMERYVYDYFVQPRYQRLPKWMIRVVQAIVPRPDAVIYLHGAPQLIHERKPELPVEEVERQQVIFQDLLLQMSNGCVIDVSAPASAVTRQIAHVICRVMEQRGGTRDASAVSGCP